MDTAAALQLVLGYLNFSEGRPDVRLQKTLSDLAAHFPPALLHAQLRTRLHELQAQGTSAFRDIRQAEAVLRLVFEQVVPALHAFHADLLFHLPKDELWQPFLLARAMEAVLAQGPLRTETDVLVRAVLRQLNDFVGHRPIAVLESRPKGEAYEHERVCVIPLFLRGAGVAHGRYGALIEATLDLLRRTDADLLHQACFELELLDELAVDPRAYDHGHPANRRPNYLFGEWDPHHLDGQGRYRRFVVRQLILDAILERLKQPGAPAEQLVEAAAVLAGTILMAAGVSGVSPQTHDSSVTLATLVPGIARYRDAFYARLLAHLGGAHGERLRKEAEALRQPLGGARQHLNQQLARHRAAQLQQRHVALLLADLGYAEASRRMAGQIPAASVRMLSELHVRLTAAHAHTERGELSTAAELLRECEDLLQRGIACGALADPWNILGFGGLFPLFTAVEDSVRDTRLDDLLTVVDRLFNLHARLVSEAAVTGDQALADRLTRTMRQLAEWWDRFATYEVGDVRRVHGGEAAASAEHVAAALGHWRARGEMTADLPFWRGHLEGFRAPKAFALVADALLGKQDYRAAMALLMSWLSQLDQVPLEDGEYSFHALALRWMLGICREVREERMRTFEPGQLPPVVAKFLDYLEANAEDYWSVPRLELLGVPLEDSDEHDGEEEDDGGLYDAAYEQVTYKDSTDDDVEAEVLEVGPQQAFDLELEGERIEKHLRFLATVARLWNVATRMTRSVVLPEEGTPAADDPLRGWLQRARQNLHGLLELLDSVHEHQIPAPSGSQDSLVEYDRRRLLKDRLQHATLATCLDTALAVGALQGRLGVTRAEIGWEIAILQLEQALWRGDAAAARILVPAFLKQFRQEPLLFTPLSNGGHPRQILRASRAQTILRALAANLPRLGLLRECYLVVRTAHEMERKQPLEGPRVTEFDRLVQVACQASVDAVLDATSPQPVEDTLLVETLERWMQPFLPLWTEHSRTLRVAMLEAVTTESEWLALREFIQRYGRELFHVRFMALGNLRGILHRGVGGYLDDLIEQGASMRLLDDLGQGLGRADAERRLHVILQTLIENYDIYKDYNATSPQSDYGDNLVILFDFLRLKASYERQAWLLRPLVLVHEVLAKRRPQAAVAWLEQYRTFTLEEAERHLQRLVKLEAQHGLRLNTVRDRVEERFSKSLALDRLCALVEPAMKAAYTPDAPRVLADLERELQPYLEQPSGVGLDVPAWLQRLEGTVQQIRAAQTAVASLAEQLLQIPKVVVPLEELEAQLGPWHKEG